MGFVSELDQFLKTFDKKYPQKSTSQLADIQKHQGRIFKLRDNPIEEKNAHNKALDFLNHQ